MNTSDPAPRIRNEGNYLERVQRVTQPFDEPQRI